MTNEADLSARKPPSRAGDEGRARSARAGRLRTLFVAAMVGAFVGALLVPHRAGAPVHSAGDLLENFARIGFPPGMLISLLFWLALSVYWELTAKGAAENVSREPALSRAFHLTLVSIGQALLLFPISFPALLRARYLPASTILIVAGLTLELASVIFSIWARRTLGRNWSGAVATKVDHELVRSGPYRWVRHPIYTGMFGLAVGTAMVSGEVRGLVGIAVLVVAFWRKVRMEESLLEARFGPAWQEYRSATRSVIPGVL